jgi:hypothetical protein
MVYAQARRDCHNAPHINIQLGSQPWPMKADAEAM